MQGALTRVSSFSKGLLQSPTPQTRGNLLAPIATNPQHPTSDKRSEVGSNHVGNIPRPLSPSSKGLSQMSFGDIDYDDLESGESRSRSARRHISDVNIEIMTSFVPDTLASQIYTNIHSRKHMEHHSRIFEGVVMIVDISGFTKLSGAFCAKGRDGIDGLQQIVNGFMGILVEAVYSFGGDVIKFAGDALICIFEPQASKGAKGLLHVCMQSVLCAWKLKDVHTEQLTAHIGIAYGDICFGVVGGHSARWEFLVSGACLAELSGCLDDAPSRNVAVTRTFYNQIHKLMSQYTEKELDLFHLHGEIVGANNNVKLTECAHSSLLPDISSHTPHSNLVAGDFCRHYQTDPPAMPLDMTEKESRTSIRNNMLPFIPQAVIEALNAETFNFIAELREVTTVFIKWDGFDMSEHADVMSLQRPFFAAQEIIAHAGGFLRQFLVDDKGCVLIAMWGVPAATFPDNALRALWATVTMCQKLRTMHMPLSCGITTGNVYCGTVGSMLRQEYAAIGDVVNLAARLMSKAHDTIYTDEASYTRLPEQVQAKLEGLPEITVKGKDVPIKPYKYKDIEDYFDFKDIGFSLESFPIRQKCMEVFSPLIAYLRAGLSPETTRSSIQSFLHHPLIYNRNSTNHLGNAFGLGSAVTRTNAANVVYPQFVVVEGPAGTGRGRALSWLKHNAAISGGVKVLSVSLGKMDSAMDYSLLAKLFRQFITEDEFDDDERQYNSVNNFLDQTYPTDRETKEKVAFPTLQQVLGVTTQLRSLGSARSPAKTRKLNPRIMVQSLLDIFQSLLRLEPTLISIENSQHIDLKSWDIIYEILNWENIRAVVVLASLPVTAHSSNSNLGSPSPGQMPSNSFSARGLSLLEGDPQKTAGHQKALENNFVKLFQSRHCHHIILSQYSFSEMRVYLAHCLNVRPNSLPKGLDVLVFQLSAGNPLWVSEICEYIKSHSVAEFIKAMTGQEYAGEAIEKTAANNNGASTPVTNGRRNSTQAAQAVKDSLRNISSNLSFYFDVSFMSKRDSGTGSSPATRPSLHSNTSPNLLLQQQDNHGNTSDGALWSTRPSSALGTVHEHANPDEVMTREESNAASTGRSNAPVAGPPIVDVSAPGAFSTKAAAATAAATPNTNTASEGDSLANNKLSFLIVCRFAKLSSESQTVARSASIVGSEFTVDVLESVTPPKLKRRLNQILNNLVVSSWLDVVEEKSLRGEPYKVYSFSHSLVHHSLYMLTPKGIRKEIHLTVARHLEQNERKYSERHGYFEQLAYHYSNTDSNQDKEFYYLTRTSLEYIGSILCDLTLAVKFLDKASSKGVNSNDMAALIGVIQKIRDKIKQEEAKIKAEELKQKQKRQYLPIWLNDRVAAAGKFLSRQPQRIRPGADTDSDSNLSESLNILESAIESKEREFLDQEMNDKVVLTLVEWQKGLIYLRKKKDRISNGFSGRSGRIGRGLAGVLSSFSRKAGSGGGPNTGSGKSMSFFSSGAGGSQKGIGSTRVNLISRKVSANENRSGGGGVAAGAVSAIGALMGSSYNDNVLSSTSMRAFARMSSEQRANEKKAAAEKELMAGFEDSADTSLNKPVEKSPKAKAAADTNAVEIPEQGSCNCFPTIRQRKNNYRQVQTIGRKDSE